MFDEAVVVVLADESYDDRHGLTRVSVLEVWKGPEALTGKSMDSRLTPPQSYMHGSRKERVLKFVRMAPHIDSGSSVHFDGEALRMNPSVTVHMIKTTLVKPNEKQTNQALQPTPMLVTPRADARVAPSAGVANL
jgi:hypothetical protein